MVDIMTAREAAEKWGVAPRRVNELIREGRIKGVYKIGAAWVMPADTEKPSDLRKERNKIQKSVKSGEIINVKKYTVRLYGGACKKSVSLQTDTCK